jgi:trimethylamine--corrinoid protein Co-methyltransferase
MQRGIPVDDDQIAVSVIRDAGPQGQFISHDHTLEHLRATQWRPKLLSRMGFENWEETGSQSLLQRAQQRLAEISDKHHAPPIAQDKQRKIQTRVDRFKV